MIKAASASKTTVVIWRGRHVTEPHHLSATESVRFHREVLRVGAAIEEHFRPLKISYMTLGNGMPHPHTHVTARYWDDRAPGGPLPKGPVHELPPNEIARDVAALAQLLG